MALSSIPVPPYSPEQKGTVEGGVKYAQRNFVPGGDFKNIEDLKSQLKAWTETANKKVHGTTGEVINVRFESFEKEKLQPLPVEEFSFFNRCERIAGMNCHIHFENNYYSVPFSYVGKTVTVRWSDTIVRIIYQGEQVAIHKLSKGAGRFITQRAHPPAHKLYSEEEYRRYHEDKMTLIGVNAKEYFSLLLEKQPAYWRQTLRPIYGFVSEYGNGAVDKALGRALSYGAFDTRIIRKK